MSSLLREVNESGVVLFLLKVAHVVIQLRLVDHLGPIALAIRALTLGPSLGLLLFTPQNLFLHWRLHHVFRALDIQHFPGEDLL